MDTLLFPELAPDLHPFLPTNMINQKYGQAEVYVEKSCMLATHHLCLGNVIDYKQTCEISNMYLSLIMITLTYDK